MSATRSRVGRGITLGYDLSSPYSTYVSVAEMCRIVPYELDVGQVEATHLTSDDNAREFLPSGFNDWGSVEVEGNYYTDDMDTLQDLAEAQTIAGWKITIPDRKNSTGTDTTFTFLGFITKFRPFNEGSPQSNDPLRHSLTIKITGKVTTTPATSGA